MSWKKSWRHPATQQGGGIPPGASQALPDTLLCCLLRQELLFPQQGNFLGSRQQQGGSRSWEPSWLQPPLPGLPCCGGTPSSGWGLERWGRSSSAPQAPTKPIAMLRLGLLCQPSSCPGVCPRNSMWKRGNEP